MTMTISEAMTAATDFSDAEHIPATVYVYWAGKRFRGLIRKVSSKYITVEFTRFGRETAVFTRSTGSERGMGGMHIKRADIMDTYFGEPTNA